MMLLFKEIWLPLIFSLVHFNLCHCGSPEQEKWEKMGRDDLEAALKNQPLNNKAKNVIFFLGDGMDVTTVTTSRILKGQLKKKLGLDEYLVFERFSHSAMVKTYNVDRQVPDSAGTATAFLSGVKGNYGTLGVDSNVLWKNCSSYKAMYDTQSIFHHALRENKAVGFVTTTRVTHATPATLYAHTADRNWEDNSDRDPNVATELRGKCVDIASQMLMYGIDYKVILGGGRRNFLPDSVVDPEYPDKNGSRTDGKNLIEEWTTTQQNKKRKAKYVWRKKEFDAIQASDNEYILGLFEPSHMEYDLLRKDSDDGEPSIADMTRKAIEVLSHNNDNGFFLFVEGGRIDHAHHETWAKLALHDTLAFEKAVSEAVALTSEHETLILVSADHSHVFTFGAYAGASNGIFDFTDHDEEGKGAGMALDNKPYTTLIYANGRQAPLNGERKNLSGVDLQAPKYEQQAAIPLNYESHGGDDITVYANGPMSHLLHRVHEQSYIAHVIKYAACIGEYAGAQCMNLTPATLSAGCAVNLNFWNLLIVLGLSLLISY